MSADEATRFGLYPKALAETACTAFKALSERTSIRVRKCFADGQAGFALKIPINTVVGFNAKFLPNTIDVQIKRDKTYAN